MNALEIFAELQEKSLLADAALQKLYAAVSNWAEAEREYKVARARATIEAVAAVDVNTGKKRTVQEIEADVDEKVASERFEAHLAEGMKMAAFKEVDLRMAQISAMQTIASTLRKEMGFVQTGPALVP